MKSGLTALAFIWGEGGLKPHEVIKGPMWDSHSSMKHQHSYHQLQDHIYLSSTYRAIL
jgi:hypothetical protein